ncbi:hypothetical protein PZA11_000885 [Diplocarpon coronariae]|uniref:Uncharacterized protein n=1 Tax=Diplocarpon coronariae TaxID=2795749 RepID=A0A218ZD39_9HELO|nr:hypothetical protein B2J93_1723 [Marssonina coronariae]
MEFNAGSLLTRPQSPDSTVEESEDEPAQMRPDPRTSLNHVLDNSDSRTNTPQPSFPRLPKEMPEDEEVRTPGGPEAPSLKPTASTSRKRKEPATGNARDSIYAGNKIKHLKKDDGEPLWRKDIQYDFLKAVFDNDKRVFTNSYEPDMPLQNFADLYLDTMARSSKTSKILRDKLLTEHEPAKNMAMVCLLVNLGRMNTTLNFFPEMRAQLRTYHAIPSLQAHQDPNSYKQLQDAPRLKSILKGASEDRSEPGSLEKIKAQPVPRTNPVNAIFVLAQFAPKVTELHFPPNRDFYDVLMAEDVSSESRARAFLWLMWFYLESDFTEEGADENPFGAGVDYEVDVRNQGVPRYDYLTPEQQAEENVDPEEEIEYGRSKQKERRRIIEADQAAFQAEVGPPKRGPKPKLHLPPEDGGPSPASLLSRMRSKDYESSPAAMRGLIRPRYESDLDSTRSTPPPRAVGGMRIQSVLHAGKGRGSLKNQIMEGSSPAHAGEPVMRRSRPLTQHQLAVEKNRNQRVDHILSRGLRKQHHFAKKQRRQDGAFWRALQRVNQIADPFEDSEGEESVSRDALPFRERGVGGLVQLADEEDDFGEELSAYSAAFRRMTRRLDRWEGQRDLNLGVMGTNRINQNIPGDLNGHGAERDNDETEDERQPVKNPPPISNGHARVEDEEDLDDMEKEILGMGSDEGDADEDLDDVDKALLNLGGDDETEDENSDGMEVD